MQITSTREEKLEALHAWQARRTAMEEQINAFEQLAGVSFESPFITCIHAIMEADSKITSLIVDDRDEWLDWYCYENSYGYCGMEVSIGGREQLVPDVEALLSVIEEGNKLSSQ